MTPLAALLRPFINALRGLAGVPLSLPVTNGEFTACASGFALLFTCIMNSITVIRYYKARKAALGVYFSAFSQVLPMAVLMYSCGRWLYEPGLHTTAITHPHAWLLTAGAIFADLTSRLMVSHVCDQTYQPNYLPLAIFSLSPLLKWISYTSPQAYSLLAAFARALNFGKPCCAWMVEPDTLLWLSFTVSLASLLLFFTSSVRSIAVSLDIDVFDSTKQRNRHKAALLEKAKKEAEEKAAETGEQPSAVAAAAAMTGAAERKRSSSSSGASSSANKSDDGSSVRRRK
jgi:hypothetical protein